MNVKVCTRCGKQVEESANVCSACGYSFWDNGSDDKRLGKYAETEIEYEHICPKCGTRYDGDSCPKCKGNLGIDTDETNPTSKAFEKLSYDTHLSSGRQIKCEGV